MSIWIKWTPSQISPFPRSSMTLSCVPWRTSDILPLHSSAPQVNLNNEPVDTVKDKGDAMGEGDDSPDKVGQL